MGSLPYVPHPHDDTKGGTCPPLDSPASPPLILVFYGYSWCCVVKNHVSTSTLRNMYLFNRPAGGVSLIAQPQIR